MPLFYFLNSTHLQREFNLNILKHLTLTFKISFLVFVLLCSLLFISVNLVINSKNVVQDIELDSQIRTFYTTVNGQWKEILKAYRFSEEMGMKYSSRSIEKDELKASTDKVKTLLNNYIDKLNVSPELELEWNLTLQLSKDEGLLFHNQQLIERAATLSDSLSTLTDVWMTQATFVKRKKAEKAARLAFPPYLRASISLTLCMSNWLQSVLLK